MRKAAAIAEHHPELLYARNRSLLDMTKEQLHDYASTPEKGLPERVKKGRAQGKARRKVHRVHRR